MIDVTVSCLSQKGNVFHALLYYKDSEKHYVWRTTRVRIIKGQKKECKKLALKRAEIIRQEFERELNKEVLQEQVVDVAERQEMNFDEYMVKWLDSISNTKSPTTIGGYSSNINAIICPYFKKKQIKLNKLTTLDLQDFFDEQYRLGKSARTVKHYYNNIHQALEKARKIGIISSNAADDVALEKPRQYIPQIYNKQELKELLKLIKQSDIAVPVMLIAHYGMRREEAIGLKYSQVNWDTNEITISHVVTTTTIDGKRILNKSDIPKNDSSFRTLPLIPVIRDFLLDVKKQQDADRKLFGNSYKNTEHYICVDAEGKLINPDTLTKKFTKFLKDNGLKKIRLHDLRHSVGTLLIKKVSTREVQEWLRSLQCFNYRNIYPS